VNAVVLQLPAKVQRQAKRRMNRVELDARHSWMMEHRGKWETEETDGAVHETNINVVRLKAMLREKWPDEYPPLTMARMRRDITEGRKQIERRNKLKAWLREQGATADDLRDAESALAFAFDVAHGA
jgi:hypothetical protein